MKTIRQCIASMTLVLGAYACASAPTAAPQAAPAASPEPLISKPQVAEPVAESNSSGSNESAAAEQAQTTEPDPRAGGDRKASRPPAELITNSSVLFVFNFGDSAAGQTAKEQCQESSGGAPEQLSACLQKARSKVPVESIRFVKKDSGEYWWTTFNTYKGNLLKWHIIQFQVGEQTGDRVTLKLMGKDKGIAPMTNVPRKLEIELPNDYSIVLNDSEFGKMVFDAKFGKLPD